MGEDDTTTADEGPGSVLLVRSRDAIDAAILSAQLEDEGIPCRQVGGNSALALGDLPADALCVEIWIPADRLEDGRRVALEFDRRRREGGEEGGETQGDEPS